MYKKYTKRVFDIVCVSLAFIVFWWLYIVIAVLVRVKLGSPVIFRQERPGRDEKIFALYKFRTMTCECDEYGNLLPDDIRLTKFGRWLRSSSLDELPELLNILKGDMSIVGPRPLLTEYLPYYTEEERIRHSVRPGLTGLAQTNGRNAITWEAKFTYDCYYVRNCSFAMDIRIIFITIINVLKKRDVLMGGEHLSQRIDVERRLEEEEIVV